MFFGSDVQFSTDGGDAFLVHVRFSTEGGDAKVNDPTHQPKSKFRLAVILD
jgi:hypothetical protein